MKFGFASALASLAIAASLFGSGAQAALPTGTLSFVTPSATVGANETITVWLRYTLDAGSAALSFSSNPLTGFDLADLPTHGSRYDPDSGTSYYSEFASYDRAFLNTYFSCSDTFTNGCNGGNSEYTYSFFLSGQPGMPSVNFVDQFELQPGQSYDYVFATFTPKAGGAAPGTYAFFDSGLTLNLEGVDADGNFLQASIDLTSTCLSQDPSCAFTRTVLAVPEPSSYALMALGLAVVGWTASRRRQR